ncbi:AlpA family phage regulatory protein [Mesorhizobium sp. B2-6-4]|nr:AlpA family phage regulatory protein [Mesorhizobium sp. B2-6-4]
MEPLLPPEMPLFLDWKDLKPIVRFSRATLHREVNARRFPAPITTAAQKTAWLKPDIEKWIAARIAARDAETMA